MPDQYKTLVAYFVGLSILMFAWSVFRTWEPPLPLMGSRVSDASQEAGAARTVHPTLVAAE
jgi:hypothetical protein